MKLPVRYAITGYFENEKTLIANILQQLDNGIKMLQFRADHLPKKLYIHYASKIFKLCNNANALLIIKGDITLLKEEFCHGLHLKSKQAINLVKQKWVNNNTTSKIKVLGVSCHNLREIKIAERLGANFVTLSPIFKTPSHPNDNPLGFYESEKIIKQTSLPVYWLGGMSCKDHTKAKLAGAHGIAGISIFWNNKK